MSVVWEGKYVLVAPLVPFGAVDRTLSPRQRRRGPAPARR